MRFEGKKAKSIYPKICKSKSLHRSYTWEYFVIHWSLGVWVVMCSYMLLYVVICGYTWSCIVMYSDSKSKYVNIRKSKYPKIRKSESLKIQKST